MITHVVLSSIILQLPSEFIDFLYDKMGYPEPTLHLQYELLMLLWTILYCSLKGDLEGLLY